jgi:hypothetical protein
MDSVQQNLRDGRAFGMQASKAMLDSYSTLVSGVLDRHVRRASQGTAPAAASAKK